MGLKNEIYKECDLISLHLPLTHKTKNMIAKKEINVMKDEAILINTSRGGIVNEKDLYNSLNKKKFFSVALDVFDKEPYNGPLKKFDNCLLTSHLGSMTFESRTKMEEEATEDVINFFKNKKLKNPVPESEYLIQSNGNKRIRYKN